MENKIRKQVLSDSSIDWTQNDSQIAKACGVSRQAVWSARRKRNLPISPFKGVQTSTYRTSIKSIPLKVIAKMTVPEVAAAVGCSPGRAGCIMRDEKILHAEVIKVPRIKFPRATAAIWKKSNKQIAAKYGTTPAYVGMYRWRNKIPCPSKVIQESVGA